MNRPPPIRASRAAESDDEDDTAAFFVSMSLDTYKKALAKGTDTNDIRLSVHHTAQDFERRTGLQNTKSFDKARLFVDTVKLYMDVTHYQAWQKQFKGKGYGDPVDRPLELRMLNEYYTLENATRFVQATDKTKELLRDIKQRLDSVHGL